MSGYRDHIEKGTPGFGFQQFLWLCARGMMPFYGLRESSWRPATQADIASVLADEDLNVEQERSRLAAVQAEQAAASSRTREQWRAEFDAYWTEAEKRRAEINACGQEQLARFLAIKAEFAVYKLALLKVGDGSLAKLVEEELEGGIKDALRFQEPYEKPTLEQWIKEKIDECERRVSWRSNDLQAAIQRRSVRDAWFKSLVEVLPPPPASE